MAILFIELYRFEKNQEHLRNAINIMLDFYKNGGARFYAIEVPAYELYQEVKGLGLDQEAELLLNNFRKHAAFISEWGTNYPAHEVNYEQTIVAAATNLLLQLYLITNEKNI